MHFAASPSAPTFGHQLRLWARDAQLLLGLQLDGQPLRVPPGLEAHALAGERGVPVPDVLHYPAPQVPGVRRPVHGRRPLDEADRLAQIGRGHQAPLLRDGHPGARLGLYGLGVKVLVHRPCPRGRRNKGQRGPRIPGNPLGPRIPDSRPQRRLRNSRLPGARSGAQIHLFAQDLRVRLRCVQRVRR